VPSSVHVPVRSMVLSFVFVVILTSVTGCGAAHSLLGIHEAPTAMATSAPLTVDQAKRVLARAFTAAYQGESMTGAAAAAAQRTAYTGEGLRAVRAWVRLASIRPRLEDSPFLSPQQPRLLAVSRGPGFPRFIVAQTVAPAGGVPIVHLLTSPDAATPYRISMSAEILPLAAVKPFDPPSKGSPLVTDGTGLAVAPTRLLNRYAAWMAFPARPARPLPRLPFAADSFSGQLRAGAAGVAKAVATQATFAQVHKVVGSPAYGVRQAGGDALVFGVMERRDSFVVKSGQSVNTVADKAFVLLTGKRKITRGASMTTLEFVVFAVPRSTGRATLVAATEQIVAGSGS
jgi:hypothetical protein